MILSRYCFRFKIHLDSCGTCWGLLIYRVCYILLDYQEKFEEFQKPVNVTVLESEACI